MKTIGKIQNDCARICTVRLLICLRVSRRGCKEQEQKSVSRYILVLFQPWIRTDVLICHSPPPLILRHSLFFLPLFVAISALVLLLSWVVPKTYTFIRTRFYRQSYEPLLINDEELDVETEAVEVTPAPPSMPSGGLLADFKAHVRSMKEYGSVLFGLEVLRTLCLCALLGLSIYATILAESPEKHQSVLGDGTVEDMAKHWGRKKHKKKKGKHSKSTVDDYSSLEWGEFGVSGFYVSVYWQIRE